MPTPTISSRQVQSRSLSFHTLECGEPRDGEDPVILLHGFPQTSHMWRHQLPVLGERFHCYAPDTRGYGGTDKPRIRLDRGILARDVIDFMDAHADKPITLADLARTAGLSRMHFAAQFRKATNLRPHEYLLRRRIEKAKVMLATGSSPIADVALTLGFSSQSHFTGVFKRFTGLTPRGWRDVSRC